MDRNVPGRNTFGPYPIETGGTVVLFLSRAIYQSLQPDEEGLVLIIDQGLFNKQEKTKRFFGKYNLALL